MRDIDWEGICRSGRETDRKKVHLPIGKPLVDPSIKVAAVWMDASCHADLDVVAAVRQRLEEEINTVIEYYSEQGALAQLAALQVILDRISRDVPQCEVGLRISDEDWYFSASRKGQSSVTDPRTPAGCEVPPWVQDLADK